MDAYTGNFLKEQAVLLLNKLHSLSPTSWVALNLFFKLWVLSLR